jgi:hypothetical protein
MAPSNYLRRHECQYLEQLIITSYDEDHASDLANLARTVSIGALFRNPFNPRAATRSTQRHRELGGGIQTLIGMTTDYVQPIVAHLTLAHLRSSIFGTHPQFVMKIT